MNYIKIKNLLLILLLIFALVSIYIGFTSGAFKDDRSQDYQWGPSKMLLEHQNPYQQYAAYIDGKIEKPFMMAQAPNYPASGYVFLWPYASMDWNTAKLSWSISNLIFTLLIVVGLQILFPIKQEKILFFVVLLFIGGSSWRSVLGNGQHALFVMAFFIWAIIFGKNKSLLSGIFLAISWFKYTITFPLTLFFIYKKFYKSVIVASIIHILLTLFVSYWIDQPILDFFFGPLQTAMTATGIGEVDIFGMIKRFQLSTSLAYGIILILLYLVLNTFFTKKDNSSDDLALLSFFSVFSLIIFFHLGYDFVLLLFPLWWVFYTKEIQLQTKYLILSLVVLQWYFPSHMLNRKFGYMDLSLFNDILIAIKTIIIYSVFIKLYSLLVNKETT